MSCPEFEALLDAYFDDELGVSESQEAARHLARCTGCQTRYEALEWLRTEIREAGVEYAPSPRLTRAVGRMGRGRKEVWWWGPGLLAAALLLVLLAPRIWWPGGEGGQQAMDAHLRSLVAANLVDVPSSDRHTVKPWFQGRLSFSPPVPDLSAEGFVLVGGRVEVFSQRRAAALVYKRREHVISLFIAENRGAAPGASSQAQGYHMVSWDDRGLTFRAVSDMDEEGLQGFAALFRSK